MRPLRLAVGLSSFILIFWYCVSVFIFDVPLSNDVPVRQHGEITMRKIVLRQTSERAAAVKAAFKFAWEGYVEQAFGHDEVRPVSGTMSDSRNGYGATIVDALSTSILMGLDEAVTKQIAHTLNIDWKIPKGLLNTFETTIRYLGGIVSAVDLIKYVV